MKSYVINLDRRPERWYVVREHLHDMGISVVRFSGIEGGWRGCRDSHLAVLSMAKDEEMFAIYEDDVEFVGQMTDVCYCLSQLPKEWDCLYLGGSPQEPQLKYSDNLYKANNVICAHAIMWHNRRGGAVEYILAHRNEIQKIDVFLAKAIQPFFNCFLAYPMITIQRVTNTSDTCKRSDVSTIIKNYDKYVY